MINQGDSNKPRAIKNNTLKVEVLIKTLKGLLLCIVIGVTTTMSVLLNNCIEHFFNRLVIG